MEAGMRAGRERLMKLLQYTMIRAAKSELLTIPRLTRKVLSPYISLI